MRQHIKDLLNQAIMTCQQQALLPELEPDIQIEHTKDRSHGDFATNIAMLLAKPAKRSPRDIANDIVNHLPADDMVEKVEIAGPGFINFYLSSKAFYQPVTAIHQHGGDYARSTLGAGKKVCLEFVSANPTGPLHVGHGRGAAYGACLANILDMIGYEVLREYYVNDAGRQMDILAASVWWRYLQAFDLDLVFPDNGYKGDYIIDIANGLREQYSDKFLKNLSEITQDLPADESAGGDKEVYIDAIIDRAKSLLEADYQIIHQAALDDILADIKADLNEFGVEMDSWFYESQLVKDNMLSESIEQLKKSNHVYVKDGATWFNSASLGDEKDRVLVRANGQTTYFASDVAYHMNKFARGYDQLIDVLGADHHGYVARIKAVIQALGGDPKNFSVQLVQFAILYRGEERVQMSTRSGSFVTLRELREEVGNDAARFFYVMRKVEQHMDFDLNLAKSQSHDNPVYYIQYAHARISSILRQLDEKKMAFDQTLGLASLSQLTESQELTLVTDLARYPQIIETAGMNREPHHIAHFLRDIANNFHSYYNAQQILVEDVSLRNARLTLITAVQRIIKHGLSLLGVSAPETM